MIEHGRGALSLAVPESSLLHPRRLPQRDGEGASGLRQQRRQGAQRDPERRRGSAEPGQQLARYARQRVRAVLLQIAGLPYSTRARSFKKLQNAP